VAFLRKSPPTFILPHVGGRSPREVSLPPLWGKVRMGGEEAVSCAVELTAES
jgi:hypothetical protein